ncbi:hypothetical protein C8R44DRAFT_90185 [Mycena epipterygia]|nr:hypothetical protein C8R44DRAFT_90185 [Mycena epipterygia]
MGSNRVLDHSRSINVSSPVLITQLNQLLLSLDIPLTLESHRYLTPSLLIRILDSFPSVRLPISAEERQAISSSDTAKVHCMKIFLGVLQADILHQDVGISHIDPRKLARGADEETIFIARLLCWYGRRTGLIARGSRADTRNDRGSPSTLTTVTKRTETSPARAFSSSGQPESNTSVSAGSDAEDPERQWPLSPGTVPAAPRCIHEVPSPSLVLSPSSTHPGSMPDVDSGFTSEHPQNTTVRFTGYIERVDEDAEIAAFEAQRAAERRRRARRLGKRREQDGPTQDTKLDDEDPELEPSAVADLYAATQERHLTLMNRIADVKEKLARLDLDEYHAVADSDGAG